MFALSRNARNAPETELPASQLGRGLSVWGLIETDAALYIHGIVRGRIDAGLLVIEPTGFVHGDIVADEVRIAGRLDGRVFAPKVAIADGALIVGRIFHSEVSVSKAARIDPEARMPWRPPSYFQTLAHLPEIKP